MAIKKTKLCSSQAAHSVEQLSHKVAEHLKTMGLTL